MSSPTTNRQPPTAQVCGGKVLRCLTDKIDDIKADACRKEVHYFEKMEVIPGPGICTTLRPSLAHGQMSLCVSWTRRQVHTCATAGQQL